MKKYCILAAFVALAASCGPQQKKAENVEAPQRVLTRTESAQAATIDLTEEFTSEIQPFKENDITPAVQGVHIDRILVDVGAQVDKGQLLVTLDPTQYNQQLVTLKNLESDYNRLLPVFEAGGISAQQIDQARTQLDVQREVVANLQRNIELRSPISGVVTARNSEAGDLFANTPILHVMQIDPLKVVVNIPEQYFPAVRVGMPVDIRVDLFGERVFPGRVSLVYPALDASTRTFTVEVSVPNAAKTLRPGMFARTIFNMGRKDAVLVPDVAVQKQVGSSERYVYVIVGDSVAERRRVEPGRQAGDRIDVLSGVQAGERVAVTALSKLSDGAAVEILDEQAK